MIDNRAIRAASLYTALSFVSITALANDQRYQVKIPTTNAIDALSQLATQTEYPLLLDYDEVKSITVNGVNGVYTLQETLDLMFKDTGFIGGLVNGEVISIFPNKKKTEPSSTVKSDPKQKKVTKQDIPAIEQIPKVEKPLNVRQATRNRIDEIIVTGTNIRPGDGFKGNTPVQTLTNLDIANSGALDLVDVSSLLTVNSGSSISQETGSLIGTSQFNIRGLGVGSTLTLINGRRGGVSTVSDSTGVLFFNNKQLPLAMIKRIDVQTDGASSIYGSDAVGGVVNIITRKGFEGLDVSAHYQNASNDALAVNLASGFKTKNARVNLYASAYTQTRNHRTDFDWLVERIHGNGDLTQSRLISSQGSPGSYRRAIVTGSPSIDPSSATITESGSRFADPDCEAAFGVLVGGRCAYNFADQVAPIPEEKRVQLFSEIELSLADNFSVFSEFSFSKNDIQRTRGPNSFRNGLVESGDIFVPADHPFNFWTDDPNNPGSNLIYIAPQNWDNSIHQAVDLVCECRPLGFEANGFDNNPPFNLDIGLDYFRGVAGFDWGVSDTWSIRANYIHSLSERRFQGENNWDARALNGAVLNGSFNPFGTSRVTPELTSPKDGLTRAGNSAEIIDQIQNVETTFNRALQQVAEITASGDLFKFRHDAVAIAFGAQFRNVDYMAIPDALTAAGLGNGPEQSSGFDDSQDVFALFGEVAVPVAENIDVQLALRRENYGGTIGSTTNPKIGARWDVSPSTSLHGSFGSGFRGPSLPQIGRSASTAFIDDPVTPSIGNAAPTCGGVGQSNIASIRTEGSDSLKPESSKNLNLGATFKPVDRFDVKVDYWQFNYKDLITADEGPQAIVENDCNDDGIPNDPRILRTSEGQITAITSEFINTGSVSTNGIDISGQYVSPDTSLGKLTARGNVSYVNKFDVKNAEGVVFNGTGNRNFTNQFSSLPRLRANATLNWNFKNQSLNVGVRHIGDYDNDQNPGFTIGSWTAVDLQYRFDWDIINNKETSVIVGARNLFDIDPPSLGDGQRPAYDDRVHDIRGRAIYLGLKQKL